MEKVFKLLDDWRQLPGYQLERRADIFFGRYLKEILENCLEEAEEIESIIPEFPLRKDRDKHLSFKVDYVAFSKNGKKVYLVELKTDENSFSIAQLKYLIDARENRFDILVNGVLDIFFRTKQKKKYFNLLKKLEKLGFVTIPSEASRIMKEGNTLFGINKKGVRPYLSKGIAHQTVSVVYIKPLADMSPQVMKRIRNENIDFEKIRIIDFEKINKKVLNKKLNDPLAILLSNSLKIWRKQMCEVSQVRSISD